MTVQLESNPPLHTEGRVGEHLRHWRTRHGWSQLKVAVDCDVSARHLSFVETGRARPSKALVVHLARSLGATNQELNVCLLAGGYAPLHIGELGSERTALAETVRQMIDRHHPYPAFEFDADWLIRQGNAGGRWLCSVLMPEICGPGSTSDLQADMIGMLTHSAGLLSCMRDAVVVGWAQLRQLRLEQLTNPELKSRVDRLELSLRRRYPDYAVDEGLDRRDPSLHLDFDTDLGPLSFFTLQGVVGIPQQVTVATPRVELWFPANPHTRRVIQREVAALDG